MGRYDLDWIIIQFVIYLDTFFMEKNGGIILQGHLVVALNFENWGWKPFEIFQGHFEASNDIILV
jgi:hypothetical protein